MSRWFLDSIEINGGFLSGFSLEFHRGLTCIIGPRGSGKSTLTEAIRYGIVGLNGASKSRSDLIQANLGPALITIRTAPDENGPSYIIRRSYKQTPTFTTTDGKPITTVDLDRGTFLPIDGYSSTEIESIADENLGEKRRALLDALRSDELQQIHMAVSQHRRLLEASADSIRATQRLIDDLAEQIEELGDARVKLAALPSSRSSSTDTGIVRASQQQQINEQEWQKLSSALGTIPQYRSVITQNAQKYEAALNDSLIIRDSTNSSLLKVAEQSLRETADIVQNHTTQVLEQLKQVENLLQETQLQLKEAHALQKVEYMKLEEKNLAASNTLRQRTVTEQAVAKLDALELQLSQARQDLKKLHTERKTLKGTYLLELERISQLRELIAGKLQREAGDNVRIRVLRNADNLNYQQMLIEGLHGARVRNHEDILANLMRLRPEQLAQIIHDNDLTEFEEQMALGSERARKILDAFKSNIDPLDLELVVIDDRICIELNVATGAERLFKDAADLSRGQKCTALLPLLLARRDIPLVIDQPEDNLDNHFIYETVVDTIQRLKGHRQMIFITHNANIPVLAEADLVVVLDSDGKTGYIQKSGPLDDCRDEIIDLLEGGREAFELRRLRYAK